MESHKHGNVYRTQQDSLRIINDFGRRPAEPVRNEIRSSLETQRKKFIALEQMRQQKQERKRGMGH